MKIFSTFFLATVCLAANAQTFTNNTIAGQNSWNNALTRTVTVSGLATTLNSSLELVQVNLSLGATGATSNRYDLNKYNITLTSPTGTVFNITPANTVISLTLVSPFFPKKMDVKYRSDNGALGYPNQLAAQQIGWALGEPWDIGYYKIQTGQQFSTANGTNPNGAWTLTINENAATQGIRFNKIDLVFAPHLQENSVVGGATYDQCATPVCLEQGLGILATNSNFSDPGNGATDPALNLISGCQWNGQLNNTSWYRFRASAATTKITISSLSTQQQAIVVKPSVATGVCGVTGSLPNGNNTDWTVPTGGSPCAATNDTYLTDGAANNYNNGSFANMQFNLSGLTVGDTYYLVIDGVGGTVSPFYIDITSSIACCPTVATITNPQAVSCAPGNDGILTATGTVGVAPYSYLWNNGAITATITGLTTGTYTVTVTDFNGCSKTAAAVLTSPLLPTTTSTANGGTAPITVCAGTTVNLQTLGSLPAGASVDWYSSTTAGNAPPTNAVLLGNTNATGCSAICPEMLAVFINSCNGTGLEHDNEYFVFTSGGGFNTNTLQADLPNNALGAANSDINLGAMPCGIQTPSTTLMTALQTGACTNLNLIAVGANTFIPSGAIVILFTSNNVTVTYNFDALCAAGQAVYIMQSACTRTQGAFVNSANCTVANRRRTTTISLSNCPTCSSSISYIRCGMPVSTGVYAVPVIGSDSSTVANGGILVNTANPCNGANFAALPVPADTLRFAFATTAANCNTTRYIKGIVQPTIAGCPNYTQEFLLNVICPTLTIDSTNTSCNLSNGTATANPGATLSPTYLWNTGATTATIIGLAPNTYTVTVSALGATCSSVKSVTIQPSSIPTLSATAANQCNTGTIQFNALPSPTSPGATYVWASTTGFTSNIANPTITNASTANNGTYTVTATFVNGCTRVASLPVNVLTQLNGQITNNNPVICTNSILSLTATGGNPPYNWVGPAGNYSTGNSNVLTLNNATVAMSGVYTITVTGSGACSSVTSTVVTVSPCSSCNDNGCKGPNLVQNADFANDFTGFTSQYNPNRGNASCLANDNDCSTAGTSDRKYMCQYGYAIANAASPCNPTWSANIQDHTPTGNGNFMIVDFPAGIRSNILCTNVVLGANKTYCVGGYFINLLPSTNNDPDPKFQFSVGGVIDPSIFTVDNDEQWQFKGISYTTGNIVPATVQICIRNENFGTLGFDVALDDITVREDLAGSAPTAIANVISACNGGSVTRNVLRNDTGIFDPATLTISTQAPFSLGTAVANADSTVTFTPTATFTSGSTDFEYRICNTAGTCCANGIVTVTSSISVTSVQTPTTCGLCNGTSTATVVGGTPPFIYTWTNTATGAVAYTGTSNTINTLCSGNYTVGISDANSNVVITNIFSENFDGVNNWTMNVPSGANSATDPNIWEINDTEGGVAVGNCGVASNGDKTLHITCQGLLCSFIGTGALYNASNLTNIRTESPIINTTGHTNMTLAFDYIGNGQGLTDDAQVLYNANNTGWVVLSANLKSIICGSGQGQWTGFTIPLPAACENIANLKIGFNWKNNADNMGSDPSFAVNNIRITKNTTTAACTASTSISVAPSTPAIVTITSLPTNTTICNGSSITLTATPTPAIGAGGGYLWDTGATTASITVAPIITTTYTVTATISAGCTAVTSITVTVFTPTVSIAPSPITICNGASTTLTTTPNPAIGAGGGYLWNTTPTQQTTASISVNPSITTTYTVTATISAGCTATKSVTVSVISPTVTLTPTPTQCNLSAGTVTAAVIGGGLNIISYAWSNSTSGILPTLGGLSPGTYSVVATVAGCSTTATATVGITNLAVVTTTPSPSICGLTNGSATASFSIPLLTPTYTWTNAAGATVATGATASNLIGSATGTTYTVTANFAAFPACSATQTVVITDTPLNLGVTVSTSTNPTCGNSDGLISVIATGQGSQTPSYAWTPAQPNSASLTGLAANTYTVIVSVGTCSTTTSTSLSNSVGFTATTTSQNATCGAANGTATVSFGAVIQPSPPIYTPLWSDGQTTETAIGLAPNTYTVTVTNTLTGCTSTSTVTVGNTGSPASVAAVATDISCTTTTGTATATVDINTTVSWSFNNSNALIIDNLIVGIYTVIATNSNGCTARSTVTVANTVLSLSVSLTSINPGCTLNDGSINTTVTGLNGAIPTYTWLPTLPNTANQTNLAGATYTVTVSAGGGCTASASVFLQGCFAVFGTPTATTCAQNNGQATVATIATTFLWSNGKTTRTIDGLSPGTYTVTATIGTLSSSTVVVVAQSTNTAAVNIADNPVIYLGQSVAISANGNSAGSYLWSNTATTNPITVSPTTGTTYTVTFTNANGCTATDVVQVVVNEFKYDIPNFFTPNGDTNNDYFTVVTDGGVEVTKMQIFNRWGELIFDKPYSKWDGNYLDAPQPMDTYVYIITVVLPNGKEETKVGDIFLIR